MCLILIAIRSHPSYKLIIAGNRDEYHDRPTAKACFWKEAPELLAGKDLRAGGTWFGITKQGRIAGLTDYRDPALIKSHAPSRGEVVRNFLLSRKRPEDFLNGLAQRAGEYNGFNLIVGERDDYYWYSNTANRRKDLTSGIYGLSNHLLDTPWPKVISGKKALSKLILEKKDLFPEDFFTILSDTSIAKDKDLPHTGIDLEWERTLSSTFITSPEYGTRSSTVLMITPDDHAIFVEKSYGITAEHASETRYEFKIDS